MVFMEPNYILWVRFSPNLSNFCDFVDFQVGPHCGSIAELFFKKKKVEYPQAPKVKKIVNWKRHPITEKSQEILEQLIN